MRITSTKHSFLKRLFLVLFAFTLSVGTVGCDDDDNGTNTDESCTPLEIIDPTTSNTITGTLKFTYAGGAISESLWPHSASTSDAVAGYFRIGLIPATSAGMATSGPAYLLGGTGMGTGMKYCMLTNNTLEYQFTDVINGTYLVAPTYENIRDANTVRKSVGLGHWGDATKYGYGTSITVNSDAHQNIDMYCDMAVGAYAYDAMRRAGLDSGSVVGTVTVDDATNWPTGTPGFGQTEPYLALIGYKDYETKAAAIAAGGVAPDLYVVIPKPATTDVNIMAFIDKTHISFASGDQTYKCIIIDSFTGISYTDDTAEPLAQYENLTTGDGSFTFNVTYPLLVWQTNITLP
ncbi:hypothetical protein Ctha_1290 [Chloroherpeton thalassium ATCC 35110]|uniref:Lipoprotein n=1 Tax=Chloroherpeton thalassium (strain ATCC 35110 / GB-78) TaxID=517418 RepID=B3QZ60_CHLT3|nr:hypothetical protein [Chloroherpeton thalassium]ACF13753.1 hypothetical protein Ctha_1290 [Chloroherpeton thalassium ATCC 35110]